jgi:hypothetical protein
MKRVAVMGALGLLLLLQTGCIAVSAKEIHQGMRYEAVAAADGKIYVVDKVNRTAREVTLLSNMESSDP